MKTKQTQSGDWPTSTKKMTLQLAAWTGAWVLTVALATFGPEFIWGSNQFLTVIAPVLNLGVGAGMIGANIQHLGSLDEMMQRIQLEAMAITLGVALVGGISLSLLDTTDLIGINAEIGYLILLMGITYLITFGVNKMRYQ